jgi:hypothetical protein
VIKKPPALNKMSVQFLFNSANAVSVLFDCIIALAVHPQIIFLHTQQITNFHLHISQ